MDGWVKLHRKILDNDAIFRAKSTFPVLCMLLLLADKDGVVLTGRNRLASMLKMKPSTLYLALKRLENLTVIKIKPDNKKTTIYICNWSKYQAKPDRKVTTKQQVNDTIQELRNNKKNKQKKVYDFYIPEQIEPQISDYVQMRKAMRKPMTDRAIELLVKKLQRFYPDDYSLQKQCLENAIERGWTTVYPLNDETSGLKEDKIRQKMKEFDEAVKRNSR